jgi:hypothetical protein
MSRVGIEFWLRRLEAAYRTDPFHAFRKNLESVRPEEWDVKPAEWSVEEFGNQPELSICDLALHAGGAHFMYANKTFGDGSMEWGDIHAPERDMASVFAWLDEGHQLLADGLAALTEDAQLAEERHFYRPVPRELLLGIVINHDLYHSGEINRQRALLRGATGWAS